MKYFCTGQVYAWLEEASSSVPLLNTRVAAVTCCKMPALLASGRAAQSKIQPQGAAKSKGGAHDFCEV